MKGDIRFVSLFRDKYRKNIMLFSYDEEEQKRQEEQQIAEGMELVAVYDREESTFTNN